MSPVTYQTIELTKGKHSSPDEGACVMELASMLAGEPFSDHPASVCPVIGSFLRAYNDSIGDELRQDLYAYASQIVGTRASLEIQRERVARVTDWAVDMQRRRPSRFLPFARLRTIGLRRQPSVHAIGTYAVHAIPKHTAETHADALALIDKLLVRGRRPSAPPPPLPVAEKRGALLEVG
jgi:hypothetical protein